jgi:F-type H+-transporting ATPase subunit gamma
MASLKEIKQSLKTISTINEITQIYQEIASIRIKETLEGVLRTRFFLDGLAKIYNHVKAAYLVLLKKEISNARENLSEISFLKRNGKQLAVFLSANSQFYGPLIIDGWNLLRIFLKNKKMEVAVVGKIGRALFKEQPLDLKTFFFDLEDERPSEKNLKIIVDFIKNYEKILVFHGKFYSFLHQEMIITDISGGITLKEILEKESQSEKQYKKYLVEPSFEELLDFFETEIVSALFNQTILEHQLARFGSRMIAMDNANQNAKKIIKKLKQESINFEKQILNKKQLQNVIALKNWNQK